MKFKVLVKDLDGKVLHEPEFSNLEEAQKNKEFCEDRSNYPQLPEYTVEIEDKTAEVEAEKTKEQAIKVKKDQAEVSLKAINWDNVKKLDDAILILKAIVAKIEG